MSDINGHRVFYVRLYSSSGEQCDRCGWLRLPGGTWAINVWAKIPCLPATSEERNTIWRELVAEHNKERDAKLNRWGFRTHA